MFKGYFAAVVSPFKNGALDIESYSKYISWLIESGINGVVVSGTTGESSSLRKNEKISLVNETIKIVEKKVPIIVGLGSSSTETILEQVDEINQISDIDAIMVVTPFFVKPTQNGIYEHFKCISEKSNHPIIIYNNPGRACVDINVETVIKIAKLNNVIGIKDASPDISRFCCLRKALGVNFSIFSGNDDTAPGAFAMGASGAISVSANLIPNLCVKMFQAFEDTNLKEFSEIRNKIFNIHKIMFKESSPAPLKYALSLLGMMTDEVRLPLLQLTDETKRLIKDELLSLNLI